MKVPTCSGRACQPSAWHAAALVHELALPAVCRKQVEIIHESCALLRKDYQRLVTSVTMSRSLNICCLAIVLAVSLVSTSARFSKLSFDCRRCLNVLVPAADRLQCTLKRRKRWV